MAYIVRRMSDLSEWREARNINQTVFAKKLGTSQPHVSDIERGVAQPSDVLALKIFDETGIKLGPLKRLSNPDIAVVRRLVSQAGAA